MAKVRNNIIVQGLSGSLGEQLVVKQDKAGGCFCQSKSGPFDHRKVGHLGLVDRKAISEIWAS